MTEAEKLSHSKSATWCKVTGTSRHNSLDPLRRAGSPPTEMGVPYTDKGFFSLSVNRDQNPKRGAKMGLHMKEWRDDSLPAFKSKQFHLKFSCSVNDCAILQLKVFRSHAALSMLHFSIVY
ncbi:hypothetical protein VNO77_41181 [Canavalia gladiata]|uniref:Uncharacterized protein n=1 Tax=Canavalia gladiata TaxID=3824 RepID=A0AAN9PRX4_CANGL